MAALVLLFLFLFSLCRAQMPGFVSVDCGGNESYTDELGLEWTPDSLFVYGETARISSPNENRKQYMTARYFPADNRKYCYTFNVTVRTRYLVRTSFLYGNFDESNVYPKFDISIGASHWTTIVIYDANTIVAHEAVILATAPAISICVSNATTGEPFISTIELRQFNGSLYHTDFETQFFLSLSARINFGAETNESVRYPDDPYDRIWESDSLKRANYLVDVAAGTQRISTTVPIDVNSDERPPSKVMQTAVVGQNGGLNYRLNLNGFPGNGWAFCYFAEIEDLKPDEIRKFRLVLPGNKELTRLIVNVEENAQRKYRLYEPGSYNISLPFVLSFAFKKTNDSSKGPILNAFEIYKYMEINYGSLDALTMESFVSHYPKEVWAQEGGDPCLPAPWSWVQCNSDPQPQIVSILSGRNLTGNIPAELASLTGLVELWLDGNVLSGHIPDLGACLSLRNIHLENNKLTGDLSFLDGLPNLQELYVQNNMLSGTVPGHLLGKNIVFTYYGNPYLDGGCSSKKRTIIVIFCVIGFSVLLATVFTYLIASKKLKLFSREDDLPPPQPFQELSASFGGFGIETAHRYWLSEINDATENFAKKVGSGGYGTVYYGKLKNGKEIAVKVQTNDSCQGNRQFSSEVSLLSRIHHRNLVEFLGYCQQEGKSILVYEFMHNGTLREHLHGSLSQERPISWINRLEIAEDAAKGIEYLHTGCSLTIIHRDLKTSNILLDKQMRAKVSDFGLSKPAVDESHISSVVRGTLGYLDPEYYTSQQLTVKSDVYSFGVILLELISGREPISNTNFGDQFRSICQWARFHCENGNIEAIIDPSICNGYQDIQSMWKIADVAVRCVNREMRNRPFMSEVLKEIQEAITMEQAPANTQSVDFLGIDFVDTRINPRQDADSSLSFNLPQLR
ncbi:probable LRR receptor-like serine/threonine-protein kinase At1g67720 isoform X2 [Zingiber officinale]|uniref:probable LRR receptor-like serine/threonine-protein kinase At1g67720 isoform X2 n=1 Tax=Zingiber officinale TaxID=94328 RepID=UPI001C4C6626|nr:probable LRR receptor-like serine/threonine-protein kinase At1g67720 isoform X2 [Zingiber officinale]